LIRVSVRFASAAVLISLCLIGFEVATRAQKPTTASAPSLVPLPAEIQCLLKGVSSSMTADANDNVHYSGGSVESLACRISGGGPKGIPLASNAISEDGTLATRDFGPVKITISQLNSAQVQFSISPAMIQPLKEFLGGSGGPIEVPPADFNAPSAPTPAPTAAPMFPKPDPANFTATSPTTEVVNAFLNASWGYDENRVWQVEGILKTPVDGVSKVIAYVGDKTGKTKPIGMQFYVMADQKHIIASDEVLSFGERPFDDNRAELQKRADGPYRGSASKEFELVEFADFQCPHCKEAQPNMEKLAVDFPNARLVFQNFPLPQHPAAAGAAAYGVCVNKLGGSAAFFKYASAVFEGQDGLSTPDGETLTLNSAVTTAGLDPAKVEACAKTPEVEAQVKASAQLAKDVNVNQTPALMVNGRQIPANAPYETLKQIILYQEKLDGIKQ
jgi:protein-disulfide isomerase